MNQIDTKTEAETDEKTPHPVDLHVGNRIALRRRLLGVSQEQLAKAVHVSFQQVQKYERGLNRVSASRLLEIAIALNVTPSFFFEDVPPEAITTKPLGSDAPKPRPLADPMTKTETMVIVQNYYRLPHDQRRVITALVDSMVRGSRSPSSAAA